jgi:hypothetical protein
MLALLSLVLYGCGNSTTPEPPVLKTVSGIVSDSTGAMPFANAAITAYAVDSAGNVTNTPLSATVPSDGQGNFVLLIPESYTGSIKLVATEKTGTEVVLNSILPSISPSQPVVISPATEIVFEYLLANKGASSFTAENIQKAILVLEPLLGQNFTQIPPPAIGTTPTASQQQLAVVTLSINSLVNTETGTSIATLVTYVPGTTTLALGSTYSAALNSALAESATTLTNLGVITSTNILSEIAVPLTSEPNISNTIAPLPPKLDSPIITSESVTISWTASSGTDVTKYYIYRNGVFVAAVDQSGSLTYSDNTVTPSTTYTYAVKARDAAGNVSDGSTITVTTSPVLTYTVSGKVAKADGSGLASVYIAISGSGSGIFLTDATGAFTISGIRKGNYTLTPSINGYTFTPESKPISITTDNISNVNFDAVAVPAGTVTGNITYPSGTIIGGISYPSGNVISGVTYPTATVVGGVTYPTGTVVGGVLYPNGVVIGGVSFPAGTIVGGVAYPVGTLSTNISYPGSTVIAGITYPIGAVIGGMTYPNGSIIGNVTFNATISGTVTLDGTGLYGAAVVIKDNITGTVTTQTTGFTGTYSFNSAKPGNSYTITSSLQGYTFSPITVTVPNDNYTNITGQNFTATVVPQ